MNWKVNAKMTKMGKRRLKILTNINHKMCAIITKVRYKPPHFTNYKTELKWAKNIQNNQNNIKQLMLLWILYKITQKSQNIAVNLAKCAKTYTIWQNWRIREN